MDRHLPDTVAAHEARLASLDPLLPRAHPLPEPTAGEVTLAVPGAVALAHRETPDPQSLVATWGAAVQHQLRARVAGPRPAGAMSALLDRWHATVQPQLTADHDVEATLTWPSRDMVMTRPILAHGLVPGTVVAARPAGRSSPAAPAGVMVRPLQPGDVADATDLWLRLVRWDAQFTSLTERPSTAAALRQELLAEANHQPRWAWVAEVGGELTGLCVVSPPERAGWIAPLTSASPTAYLGCMIVTETGRGDGVGSTLVQHAHAALDAAGVAVTLLHYAALNPLSGPFWHRCGYRPLWTSWVAYPATALRVASAGGDPITS